MRLVAVLRSGFGQSSEHIGINISSGLTIDSSCPAASVLAHALSSACQQLEVTDYTIQLVESFGRIGRSELSKMFKFPKWVIHEV